MVANLSDMVAVAVAFTGGELAAGILCGATAGAAVVAALVALYLWHRKLLPESLIPQVLLDDRVQYHDGSGTYEARQGNAMWCQDSAQDYFDHGVRIKPGMTVLDAGANVGLFALEIMERLKNDANVFCFEPVPATCSLLRLNLARYPDSCRPKVLNCGLSDNAGFVTFQVCPETNIISTAHPEVDPLAEVDSLVDFLRSNDAPDVYRRNFPGPFEIHMGSLPRFLVKWVVQQRLKLMAEREEVVCELRTLREVIASHSISVIDLLKVDVEGAEEQVLLGLSPSDWNRVQAAVVEVHDVDGRLERVRQLCLANGLSHVVVSHEPLFAAVKMRFRGEEEIEQTDMLGVVGEESFHMATLTATRYPPGSSGVDGAAARKGGNKKTQGKKGGRSPSPRPRSKKRS